MDSTQNMIGQPALTWAQRQAQLAQQEAIANGQMAPPQMQPGMPQGQPQMQPPGMSQAQFGNPANGPQAMSPQQRAQLAALLQARDRP